LYWSPLEESSSSILYGLNLRSQETINLSFSGIFIYFSDYSEKALFSLYFQSLLGYNRTPILSEFLELVWKMRA